MEDGKMRTDWRYSWVLLRELVKTEFKLRYQGSVLGYLWSLLKPLFLFAILYLVFVYFMKIGADVPHWPVGMLFGITLWNFFSETTNMSLSAIVARGDIIRKINFPKYVIVLSTAINALVNLLLSMIVIVLFMLFNGVELHWSSILAIFPVLELFFFGLGIGFILAAVFVKLRDINMIWEIVMQALFYGSAVIYPVSLVSDKSPLIGRLLLMNPVASCLQSARYFLIDHANTTLSMLTNKPIMLLAPHLIVLVVFVFGVWFFQHAAPNFAEEV